MRKLANNMMKNVYGANGSEGIDNIEFINDLALTAAIGASMMPVTPAIGAGIS